MKYISTAKTCDVEEVVNEFERCRCEDMAKAMIHLITSSAKV